MLTTEQLKQLENELLEMEKNLSQTENETEVTKPPQEEVGELSMYDNHPADMGTELYEREKDIALNTHAEDELAKVQNALQAMKEGTYGVCEVCGKDIPFERLEAIPYTSVCVEDAEKSVPDDRPAEEDLLIMAQPNSFAERRDGAARDYEDSFQEIAKSGTSETPSDFAGNENRDYEDLYREGNNEGAEEYEEFTASDFSGKERGFVRSEEEQSYEEMLDKENIESPIGDIPYRKGDSYIDDK